MDWANDKDLLVDLISYASIVSAAIFGMIGLFTDYKKDGKTTAWGHLAAGGIGLSAMLAMTSAVLQKQIASEERSAGERRARAQRALEKAQFDTQIGQLLRLNGQMAGVNRTNAALMTDMGRSLEAQGILLANARQSMLLQASLGRQQRENTAAVLATMWTDANRIDGSRMVVAVSYRCLHVRPNVPIPRFLEDASVQVRVSPASALDQLELPRNTFSDEPILPGDGVTFRGYEQEITVERRPLIERDFLRQFSRFRNLETNDIQGFDHPESWRNAVVEVLITANQPELTSRVSELFPGVSLGPTGSFADRYPLSAEFAANPFFRAEIPPSCAAGMTLRLNDRVVAAATAPIVHVREYQNDRRGLILVKFPVVDTIPDAFPTLPAFVPTVEAGQP